MPISFSFKNIHVFLAHNVMEHPLLLKKNPNQISKLIDFSVYKVGRAGPTTLLSNLPTDKDPPMDTTSLKKLAATNIGFKVKN